MEECWLKHEDRSEAASDDQPVAVELPRRAWLALLSHDPAATSRLRAALAEAGLPTARTGAPSNAPETSPLVGPSARDELASAPIAAGPEPPRGETRSADATAEARGRHPTDIEILAILRAIETGRLSPCFRRGERTRRHGRRLRTQPAPRLEADGWIHAEGMWSTVDGRLGRYYRSLGRLRKDGLLERSKRKVRLTEPGRLVGDGHVEALMPRFDRDSRTWLDARDADRPEREYVLHEGRFWPVYPGRVSAQGWDHETVARFRAACEKDPVRGPGVETAPRAWSDEHLTAEEREARAARERRLLGATTAGAFPVAELHRQWLYRQAEQAVRRHELRVLREERIRREAQARREERARRETQARRAERARRPADEWLRRARERADRIGPSATERKAEKLRERLGHMERHGHSRTPEAEAVRARLRKLGAKVY